MVSRTPGTFALNVSVSVVPVKIVAQPFRMASDASAASCLMVVGILRGVGPESPHLRAPAGTRLDAHHRGSRSEVARRGRRRAATIAPRGPAQNLSGGVSHVPPHAARRRRARPVL